MGPRRRATLCVAFLALAALAGKGRASEFPERECCDPQEPHVVVSVQRSSDGGAAGVFGPLPDHYDVHKPASAATDAVDDAELDALDDSDARVPEFIPELSAAEPAAAVPTDAHNRSSTGASHGRVASAMMNCLLAHELCTKDASCTSVNTVIRHICGPETVACSTATVTKCQAGLRTLQAFPFFHPTCLCREPSADPHCNAFRDFLFDHPCMVAAQRDADAYPIHALPTCSHALDVCRKDESCVRMYHEFREQCKQRDGTCRDREACHAAWRNLRMTPLFGCFCPSAQHNKCERLYAFIYNNTCVGGEEATTAASAHHSRVYSIYQSTCHRAMASCEANAPCRRQLEPMVRYCSGAAGAASDTCHRDLCMQSVQGFYKDAPLNFTLEVAFCVCKKSANRNDECLIAQERLHPDCARRPERYHAAPDAGAMATPACHQLADECKNHPDCKPRLEFYVQACAVDTVTKGCAGLPSICRRAVLDILGTDLRTSCNCRATQLSADVAAMYDCLEWQRLLWLNPCVVEAQRDYHKSQGNLKVVAVASPDAATTGSSGAWTTSSAGRQTTRPWYSTAEMDFAQPTARTYRPSASVETSAATTGATASSSSSAGTTPTTAPPATAAKTCALERPRTGTVHFAEGSSKRLYQDDDADCSELCRCDVGQRVTCAIVSCAERRPCHTPVAVYAHSATAFQAYRGECLCFSGAFVCAKPEPAHYSLPSGIYLFIGYSRADERAIYHITHQNVSRFVFNSIRRLKESKQDPESDCRISVHDQIEENIIYRIELITFDEHRLNNSVTLEMLTQEKTQCLPLANEIRRMINKGVPEVKEDGILSIIKVADVAAIMPEPRRSSAKLNHPHVFCRLIVSLVALSISRRMCT